MTKVDLDDIERKAQAEISARARAPRTLERHPVITDEMARASWDRGSATSPLVMLALVARIRELDNLLSDIHDGRDWSEAQIAQLLEKGAVIP